MEKFEKWDHPVLWECARHKVATNDLAWANHPEEIEVLSLKRYTGTFQRGRFKICVRYRGEVYRCKDYLW